MKWTPIKVGTAETSTDGSRFWPLSAEPPEQWRHGFHDRIGEAVTGPVDGPGPKITSLGVVWADAPRDSASANAIVKAWVDAANRDYESLVVTPANQPG